MAILKKSVPVFVAAVIGLGAGACATYSLADQPRMQTAIDHLQAAEQALSTADNDKGGHRVKALALTRDALAEARAGLRYDRRN